MNSIQFPTQTTFYIASTGADYSFGSVTSEQELITPHTTLWTTLDESEWISKLEVDYGISPYKRLDGVSFAANNDLF